MESIVRKAGGQKQMPVPNLTRNVTLALGSITLVASVPIASTSAPTTYTVR